MRDVRVGGVRAWVLLLAPSLVQSKLDGLTTRLVIAQLSLEPLSTWAAVMLTWPLASRFTSMFCVKTVGRVETGTATGGERGSMSAVAAALERKKGVWPAWGQLKLYGLR